MLLHELTLRGILSFGPDSPPIALKPLNVLIGPNGSGKSNIIEAIRLLQAAPNKLTAPFRGRGSSGVHEWIWKGFPSSLYAHAEVEAVVEYPDSRCALRHQFRFTESSTRFVLVSESVSDACSHHDECARSYYTSNHAVHTLRVAGAPIDRQEVQLSDVSPELSILSQYREPRQYPELSYLSRLYERIAIYGQRGTGLRSPVRRPQSTDLPNDCLAEDFSNLWLFLNRLCGVHATEQKVLAHLQDLYAGIDRIYFSVVGGTIGLFLYEGGVPIPASRLSDGTMNFLCLLAVLCDPTPPPLICIEEPELGLHPDMIHKVADLLLDASTRTQLIVTTHSDILVDCLTEHPETIAVVEKLDGKTTVRRLDSEPELKEWLKTYRLGELWTRGMIGGNRW